ncbi:hypothetical protein GUJ93_ZPchr0010g7515 [Zizania palustris]|uniref:Uncharacterized protein n=1 Tax=Zizania palustris TaxID=103762 RepID=A0A8J5W8J1_ZIZPA|nr:hypothetical protein GUJ93_ZPchr0010g7515 [Zizania palustris]
MWGQGRGAGQRQQGAGLAATAMAHGVAMCMRGRRQQGTGPTTTAATHGPWSGCGMRGQGLGLGVDDSGAWVAATVHGVAAHMRGRGCGVDSDDDSARATEWLRCAGAAGHRTKPIVADGPLANK